MKASSELRTTNCELRISGTGGRTGGTNAQCFSYGAPASIQRFKTAFSAAWSVLCDFGGGIRSSLSVDSMRSISALFSGRPGTIAVAPLSAGAVALARRSRRSLPSSDFASGPWQA